MLLYLRETRYTTVEVEADTYEQAQEMAKAAYVKDDIDFDLDKSYTVFEVGETENNLEERWYTPPAVEEFIGSISADGTFFPA